MFSLLKRKWLLIMVSDISPQGQLASLLWACGKAWCGKAIYVTEAREQRDSKKRLQGHVSSGLLSPTRPHLLRFVEPPKISPPDRDQHKLMGNVSSSHRKYSNLALQSLCPFHKAEEFHVPLRAPHRSLHSYNIVPKLNLRFLSVSPYQKNLYL